MTKEELKEYIKENLLIEAHVLEYSNSVKISLRFKDELDPFSYDYVDIPDED